MLSSNIKKRAIPITTSILLLSSWICALVSLGIGSSLLASKVSSNQALHKLGFSIGLIGTLLLFPPTVYTFLKARSKSNIRPGRTAFTRWQGLIAWLISAAIIISTTIILVQAQRSLPYLVCADQYPFFGYMVLFCTDLREHHLDVVIVVLCLLLGVFLHFASLLVFCKPRRQVDTTNDSSSITSIETQAVSINDAIAYLDKLPEYTRQSVVSRSYSIPRKRVDYLAYTYENGERKLVDHDDVDEKTQVGGHSTPSSTPSSSPTATTNEIIKVEDKDRESKTTDSQWTCKVLPKPYKARILNATASSPSSAKIKTQSFRNFQSLDGASLKVRNSI